MDRVLFVARTSANLKHGEVAGATSAAQLPDVDCFFVVIKAHSGNAGNVHIGSSSSVTVADGSTDTTTGFVLAAGESEQFYVNNLNLLYYICDNAGDDFTYFAYV